MICIFRKALYEAYKRGNYQGSVEGKLEIMQGKIEHIMQENEAKVKAILDYSREEIVEGRRKLYEKSIKQIKLNAERWKTKSAMELLNEKIPRDLFLRIFAETEEWLTNLEKNA
ncbi:MAG: hypothetical protein LBE38_11710, partial [Deltaproteobacteria bacterium]|nr:hypothetical protein [Deltaproteobacteria bacterium]